MNWMSNRKDQPTALDRLARWTMDRQLSRLNHGILEIDEGRERRRFGKTAELSAIMKVHRPGFFSAAVLGGRLSVAESYLRGDWDCDDLTSLFRIFLRNQGAAGRLENGLTRLIGLGHRMYHWWRANTIRGSQRNIAAHYDLGNDFYRLWLDDTLAYSCGIFPTPDASLREASLEKFDRVCRKLDIVSRDHLVEIGTGWGGFALHAAGHYGCRVTTTTISEQQHDVARRRIDESGFNDRVTLLRSDYRELSGQFDKLVSIEMIEAVGYRYLDRYFARCGQLLRPDGTMVLQAIVMPERGYDQYLNSVDFIQRYVFPGGCLPTVGAMLESAGRTTDLRFVHAEDFAPHYAETLRRWRRAFQGQLKTVSAMGFPDSFIRLWNYYLCYCEAAFEERCVGVVQIQFDKPRCRRDPLSLSHYAAHQTRKSPPLPFVSTAAKEDGNPGKEWCALV